MLPPEVTVVLLPVDEITFGVAALAVEVGVSHWNMSATKLRIQACCIDENVGSVPEHQRIIIAKIHEE